MTIKNRLFFSNILMLIIPIFLGVLVVGGMLLIYLGITGYGLNRVLFDDEYFSHAVEETGELTEKWIKTGDLDALKQKVQTFNEKYQGFGLSLSIYKSKEEVYPLGDFENNPYIDLVLSQGERHFLVMDNIAVYRENVGDYSLVLLDNNYLRYTGESYNRFRNILICAGILMFCLFVVIILITNCFLIQFVFRRITNPLDKLVNGVHQIRDGQLDYRIEYSGNDEFTQICSDFNEMAQRLQDTVKAKQKDEANRKELIAGISHDLRTPLTSIKAYVEGIEKGVASTPLAQKRYLNIIKEKTENLEQLVNQLFLFSKLDIGEFPFYLEQMEISDVLGKIVTMVKEEYRRKELWIDFEGTTQNTKVFIDRVQIQNAIINVLENSVKYCNEKPVKIKIMTWEEQDRVMISLTDNGPGVPPETLEHLFDVFYRGDPSRSNSDKGSGLGLAITAKILERQNGSIQAKNAEEGGLSIIMTFTKNLGGIGLEKNSDY